MSEIESAGAHETVVNYLINFVNDNSPLEMLLNKDPSTQEIPLPNGLVVRATQVNHASPEFSKATLVFNDDPESVRISIERLVDLGKPFVVSDPFNTIKKERTSDMPEWPGVLYEVSKH